MKFLHKCSFCGCNENEVKALVVGPKVSICDQCVEQASIQVAAIIANKEDGNG